MTILVSKIFYLLNVQEVMVLNAFALRKLEKRHGYLGVILASIALISLLTKVMNS